LQVITGGESLFVLVLLHSATSPLQGFCNCLLYFFNPVEGGNFLRKLCKCTKKETAEIEVDMSTSPVSGDEGSEVGDDHQHFILQDELSDDDIALQK
jgi:hypothetical protein